ncbi:dihydroxyacetone kinase subunit DhaL [Propionibacteriaceae bacterium G1746]
MAATLTIDQTRTVLLAACQAIIDAREELGDADRATGDGDHGEGMARGFGAGQQALQQAELATVGEAFKTIGSAVLAASGGASGVIFGTMFRAPAKVLTGDQLDAEGYAAALEAAADQIGTRGKAAAGDKTMLDALIPAAQAARASAGDGLEAAARAAAEAAEQGSVATTDMVAAFGRAKSLGERARGHRDPGSISVAILLATIADGIEHT